MYYKVPLFSWAQEDMDKLTYLDACSIIQVTTSQKVDFVHETGEVIWMRDEMFFPH